MSQVYKGKGEGTLLKFLCPYESPQPMFINSNVVKIKVKTIPIYATSSFLYDLNYVASDKGVGCGGEIVDSSGTLNSPMFPMNVRNISNCRWEITVPNNLNVFLRFDSKHFFLSSLANWFLILLMFLIDSIRYGSKIKLWRELRASY